MIDSSPPVQLPPSAYEHAQRRILATRIDNLAAGGGNSVLLKTVAVGQPVYAETTFEFSASYTTGGEDVLTTLVPDQIDARVMPKTGGGNPYTFEYSAGKLLAFIGGTEVAATTDLSSILGAMRIQYVGTEPGDYAVHASPGEELLEGLLVFPSTAITLDSTNYWTLQAVVNDADGLRREVGDPVSFTKFGASAHQGVELAADTGYELSEGDTVSVEFVAAGTPDPLVGCRVFPQIRRRIQ